GSEANAPSSAVCSSRSSIGAAFPHRRPMGAGLDAPCSWLRGPFPLLVGAGGFEPPPPPSPSTSPPTPRFPVPVLGHRSTDPLGLSVLPKPSTRPRSQGERQV